VTERATRLQQFKARLLPIALGAAAAIIITGLVVARLWRDDTPPLTAATLEAAIRRWHEHGPSSYDLDLEIAGKRAGRVHLEIRDGEPTAMTRDGRAPEQQRTWSAWTVEGQFDTIRTELDAATNPTKGFGAAVGAQIVQRARFDEALGYPLRYERFVLGADQDLDIDWRVVRFVRR
jgi:hypothetical protein